MMSGLTHTMKDTKKEETTKTPAPTKLPCYNRAGFQENELVYQATVYSQFQVVPYVCRHCNLYHLLFVR